MTPDRQPKPVTLEELKRCKAFEWLGGKLRDREVVMFVLRLFGFQPHQVEDFDRYKNWPDFWQAHLKLIQEGAVTRVRGTADEVGMDVGDFVGLMLRLGEIFKDENPFPDLAKDHGIPGWLLEPGNLHGRDPLRHKTAGMHGDHKIAHADAGPVTGSDGTHHFTLPATQAGVQACLTLDGFVGLGDADLRIMTAVGDLLPTGDGTHHLVSPATHAGERVRLRLDEFVGLMAGLGGFVTQECEADGRTAPVPPGAILTMAAGDHHHPQFRREAAAVRHALRRRGVGPAWVAPPMSIWDIRVADAIEHLNPALIYIATLPRVSRRHEHARKAAALRVREILEEYGKDRVLVLNGLLPDTEVESYAKLTDGLLATAPAILPPEAKRVAFHATLSLVRWDVLADARDASRRSIRVWWDRNAGSSSTPPREAGRSADSPTLDDLVMAAAPPGTDPRAVRLRTAPDGDGPGTHPA